ncbi:glycosyl hydrolase family 61-domain-containing protein [Lenzites betulinus]|nr:glycosyl hydrolase family 61-domain-containing protein [Lenzites betulinus]
MRADGTGGAHKQHEYKSNLDTRRSHNIIHTPFLAALLTSCLVVVRHSLPLPDYLYCYSIFTMHSILVLLACLFSVLLRVAAHGYLKSVAIDGQTYQGNVPNHATGDSPIRLIDDIDPVKGADNPNLSCGQNAQIAAQVVPANPGSTVTFAWASGNGGNWPHNTGPMLTYMAACEGTTCDKFNASGAQWFKVDQVGKKSDGSTWVQQDIMNGGTYSMKLPSNILPGDYLVRHEIIALQLAVSMGGAEFYPSCTQVRVGGTGNGAPNATVSFPGAYTDSEPGIYDPNVYNPGSSYTFPGPPIAAFVPSGGNGVTTSPTTSSAVAVASPSFTVAASGASAPSTTSVTSGSCSDHIKRSGYHPRRFRRVMRKLSQA